MSSWSLIVRHSSQVTLSWYTGDMKILGIDPGIATTGYGLIEQTGSHYQALDYGCIITDKHRTTAQRLADLYHYMTELLQQTQPNIISVEKIFFNTNITTGIVVSQARGIILLTAELAGIEIVEYTPLQVKTSVCGYGMAKKPQVQQMTQTLLKLKSIPRPDDAADALAIALCHSSLGNLQAKAKLQGVAP